MLFKLSIIDKKLSSIINGFRDNRDELFSNVEIIRCPLKAAVLFAIAFCRPLPVISAINILVTPIATAKTAIFIIRDETLLLEILVCLIRLAIKWVTSKIIFLWLLNSKIRFYYL